MGMDTTKKLDSWGAPSPALRAYINQHKNVSTNRVTQFIGPSSIYEPERCQMGP